MSLLRLKVAAASMMLIESVWRAHSISPDKH